MSVRIRIDRHTRTTHKHISTMLLCVKKKRKNELLCLEIVYCTVYKKEKNVKIKLFDWYS